MLVILPLAVTNLLQIWELDSLAFPAPWSKKSWENELKEACSWGAFQDEQLIGVVSFHVIFDVAELFKIMVHPSWRRQGVGAKLLEHSLKELQQKGVKRLFLEVAEKNQAARSLYGKYGFVISGRRENYYDNPPDNAIMMNLSLEDALSQVSQSKSDIS